MSRSKRFIPVVLLAVLVAGLAVMSARLFSADKPTTATAPTTTAAAIAPGPTINTVCPIMGGRVDPDKTPDNLARMYKGKKIGFCCPACPEKWDALTEQERDAAVEKMAKPK